MAETNLKSPPEENPETKRRRIIADRQRSSVFWRTVHILGSLKLALFLLFTIALACAVATFAESNFTTKVAQVYIYQNPLFTAWLVVLCINLFCVTLTRLPWQRKHAGFIITHYGIITLLAGAMIGHATGYEAFLKLNKGDEAKNILSTNEPILFVENPTTGRVGTVPFEAEVKRPTPEKPRRFPLEIKDLEVVVDQYSDQLTVSREIVADPDKGNAPGLSLQLSSAAMKQDLKVALLLDGPADSSFDMFGLAAIEWVEKLPVRPVASPVTTTLTPDYRENQMIFALQPDSPVIHNSNGAPSGYRFSLLPKKTGKGFDLEIIFPNSERQLVDLQKALKKSLPGAQPGSQIAVLRYWPDLRMVDGKPTSVSNDPNNPAALITFSGFVEKAEDKIPHLFLAPGTDGKIDYLFRKGGVEGRRGQIAEGTVIPTGWNDWQIKIEHFYPKARLLSIVGEAAENAPKRETGLTGIRLKLRRSDGKTSDPKWIAMGSSDTLTLENQRIRIGYGNRIIQIPFAVSLQDFQVPRDEGGKTPANFISSLLFHPVDGSAAMPGRSEMNFPASYPPELWRQFTGSTYKFSQAGWNPENLDETTLQVLHDPGWPFKWIGSLMICAGIFTMFYLKPKKISPALPAPTELS